ncbi:MAG: hypothetical protein ACRENK_03810 [Gemmatimonadaceae bacterium]
MRQMLNKPIVLVALALAAMACGSDSTAAPAATPPAGHYTATSFVTTGSFGQTNEIAAGSTFELNLLPGGAANGHLHVADGGNGQPFDADMAGTWTASGNTVTVTQSADSFVKDMPFTSTHDAVNGWLLVGDKVFDTTRIQVTLSRAASDPV